MYLLILINYKFYLLYELNMASEQRAKRAVNHRLYVLVLLNSLFIRKQKLGLDRLRFKTRANLLNFGNVLII